MKVLILSQWYPPETETRIHMLATSLTELGYKVKSLTGFPNYPSGKLFKGYKIKLFQHEKMDEVDVVRIPLYPSHDSSIIRRFTNYLSFAFSASTIGLLLCGRADVMWVYHPPLSIGLPAIIISKIRRIPFIYEIQDMWPETLLATGFGRLNWMFRYISRFAKYIYTEASAITVISEGFKQNLIKKGVDQKKIWVIPNWADEGIYRPLSRNYEFAREWGLAGFFSIVFGGNHGAAQALQNVINTAEILKKEEKIKIFLIGDGVEKESLIDYADKKNLKNICFIPRQKAELMPYFFANSDVVLIHLKKDPLFDITIPGKTIAYLACGRPIICSVGGNTAQLIQNAKAGLIVEPENPYDLANAILHMYKLSPSERIKMGANGRQAFLEKYSKAVLMREYESVFKKVYQKSK